MGISRSHQSIRPCRPGRHRTAQSIAQNSLVDSRSSKVKRRGSPESWSYYLLRKVVDKLAHGGPLKHPQKRFLHKVLDEASDTGNYNHRAEKAHEDDSAAEGAAKSVATGEKKDEADDADEEKFDTTDKAIEDLEG